METLNKFSILVISKNRDKEYILSCKINEKNYSIKVRVEMEKPVFGINYSDEFMLILRNYPQASRQLVGIIKDFHNGEKVELPISLPIEETLPELQTA